jgi:hypothetical protein
MSLDKAIESGKEHRKRWRGSKRIDKTCRNHGSCDYCKGNRLYSAKKAMDSAKEQMKGE